MPKAETALEGTRGVTDKNRPKSPDINNNRTTIMTTIITVELMVAFTGA